MTGKKGTNHFDMFEPPQTRTIKMIGSIRCTTAGWNYKKTPATPVICFMYIIQVAFSRSNTRNGPNIAYIQQKGFSSWRIHRGRSWSFFGRSMTAAMSMFKRHLLLYLLEIQQKAQNFIRSKKWVGHMQPATKHSKNKCNAHFVGKHEEAIKNHWIFAYKTVAIFLAHISGHTQKWNASVKTYLMNYLVLKKF